MPEAFHLLRPGWLWLLVPAAALLGFLAWSRNPQTKWRGIIDPRLLPHLLGETDEGRHGRLRPLATLAVAQAVAIAALAGPAWEREPSPFADENAALVVAVQATESMTAADVQPSRLERAGQKIGELLDARRGARVGLIAYAGSAHLVMPPTRDIAVLKSLVAELSPDIMPREGNDVGRAVALAQAQLERSGQTGSILLVADGIDEAGRAALAEHRARGGVPVHVFGVGVAADVSVAVAAGPAAPPLDPDALAGAAGSGGGRFVAVTADGSDVAALARVVESRVAPVATDEGGERWKDAGYGLVPILVLIALLWSRPGWAVRWE